MIIRAQIIIPIAIAIIGIALSIAAPQFPTNCNQSCGGAGGGPAERLQFPFGFSSGCPIQLNCSANGTAVIGEFPVQSVNSDGILVNLPAKCGRPIETLDALFTNNFAPTSHNGILLRNCTSPITGCQIPYTAVQTRFELYDCEFKSSNKSNNISCYSEQNTENEFIDYKNLTSRGCASLFSAISTAFSGNSQAVTLDVQVVALGWWIEGGCMCSDNANCTEVSTPVTGGNGYRCRCLDGFVGDGYRAGLGCRKAASGCDHSKYKSGQCGSTTRISILVGGIAAGAFLMVSVGLLCCLIRKRSKSKKRKRTSRRLSEVTGISIPIFPYSLIERATNFFSDKQRLGTGAYGTVYAAKLNNDEWVAIKRIKHRDVDSVEQVMNEIKLLSSVSHPNLVRLLGCSIENDEQILVYEYMPNGTLSQHLHAEASKGLTWPVRLKIATETAQAIAFLHSAMNPPIYHRDIKSTNILLDYSFKSKVADFGLSRRGLAESSHVSTAPQGTPGYLDPQYHQNFHLSDKSDVYSFGVVLVEIITGLKAVDFSRPQNEVNLAALATDRIGKGRLEEIIDPLLDPQKDEWTLLSMHKVAELSFRCLSYERDMRPSMMEVSNELEQIGLSKWGASEENVADSSELALSSCSSSSNASEKPLGVTVRKPEVDSSSTGVVKEFLPVPAVN